eukprot:3434740-Prymnesium_polylepis.1
MVEGVASAVAAMVVEGCTTWRSTPGDHPSRSHCRSTMPPRLQSIAAAPGARTRWSLRSRKLPADWVGPLGAEASCCPPGQQRRRRSQRSRCRPCGSSAPLQNASSRRCSAPAYRFVQKTVLCCKRRW